MSIVYILINKCMPDMIKIGYTTDLEKRMKKLDSTGVALPFECYYAVEVDNAEDIERRLLQGLVDYRVRESREFFQILPEQAKSLLQIAEDMGGKDVTPTDDIVETPQDKQALERARKKQSFRFSMLGISPGTELHFKDDITVTCEVIDDRKVKFRNEDTYLSNSALTILRENGYDWSTVQGTNWWCLNGETLNDLRTKMEH